VREALRAGLGAQSETRHLVATGHCPVRRAPTAPTCSTPTSAEAAAGISVTWAAPAAQ